MAGNKDGNYQFPEHERHLLHVELETPLYDRQTGQKLSTPAVQKFYEREFKQMEKDNSFAGMTVRILHDPAQVDPATLQLNKTPLAGNKSEVATQTGIQTGAVNDPRYQPGKKIEDMDTVELHKEYRKWYNEDIPADFNWSDDQIRQAIRERQQWVEAEKQQAAESNKTGTGRVGLQQTSAAPGLVNNPQAGASPSTAQNESIGGGMTIAGQGPAPEVKQ